MPTVPELIDLPTTTMGHDVLRDHLASPLVTTTAAGTPSRGFRAAMRPTAERDYQQRLQRVVYPERELESGEGTVRVDVHYQVPEEEDDAIGERREAR